MQVNPRQPDDSVNVSKTHPLVEGGLLLGGIGVIFITVTAVIVFAVDLLVRFVPPEKEVKWLSNWSPMEVEIEDTPTQRQLTALLERMSRHYDTDYRFRIGIDESKVPNAMALPGGLIVVTQGLLDAVETENELAFVIGHELGHFAERDHLRQLGRIAALVVMFAGVSSSGGGGDVGLGLSEVTLRSFNREQEARADAFGLSLLHAEYGHVTDAGAFFTRIAEDSDSLSAYFGTHPAPDDRVDTLLESARQNGWAVDGQVTRWVTEPDIED
ncbi:MAG: M48 family metallopeptidase [Gammaproteobacteria bacterium]